MRKTFTLLVIIIGFIGLFASQSLSFSNVTVPVALNGAVTKANSSLISTSETLDVHLHEKKGQHEILHLTNHLNEQVKLIKDDIYPQRGDKFFHICVSGGTIPANGSMDVGIHIYAKKRTPSGDYEITLQTRWENGKAEIPLRVHLSNELKKHKEKDKPGKGKKPPGKPSGHEKCK